MKYKFIFITILFSISNLIFSQTYHSYHYTINDFLPDNNVREIYKDSDKNLWIGTDIGVLRIKGTEKEFYTTNNGLASNKVWSITEDKNGEVWFGCFQGGVCKWNGKGFDIYATEKELGVKNVRKLYYSKKNDIMFVAGNYSFARIKNNTIKHYRNYITTPHVIVTNFLETDSVIYALSYGWHAWCYYPQQDTAIVFSTYDKGVKYNRWYYSTSNLILKNKDTIVSFHDKGINVFKKNKVESYRGFGQVFEMYEEDNKVWLAAWNIAASHIDIIGDSGGLYTFENGKIIPQNKKYNIESEECWDLWKDTLNKQLYIATNDNGLYILDEKIFINYDATYFGEPEIQANHIIAFDSSLVFNGNKNIIEWSGNKKIDKVNFEEIHNAVKNKRPDLYNNYYLKQKESKEVNFVFEIQKNGQYIYLNNKMGLFRIKTSNTSKVEYLFNPKGKSIVFYDSMFYNNTHSHLLIYDTTNWKIQKVVKIFKANLYADEGQFKRFDTIFYTGKGRNTFYEIYSDSAHEIHIPDSLTGVVINDFITDDGITFYFAMRDGNILKAVKTDTSWNWDKLKLPCNCGNSIHWILKKDNHFYFSSNLGLGHFTQPKGNIPENFTFLTKQQGYHGQISNEAVFGYNGNIFIPAYNRIIEVDTQKLNNYKVITGNLFIDKIIIEDAEDKAISLIDKHKIILPFKSNSFILHFNISEPQITNNIQYQYKLKGYQKKWIKTTLHNSALFNHVPPGNYTFMVKAYSTTKPDKFVNLSFPVIIKKPFYQTLLFRILSAIILLIVVYIIVNRQKKAEKEKWQNKIRIKELEKQSLLSKINPHFLFNSLNSVQKFILQKQNDDAVLFIGKFSKLIRQTLENSIENIVILEKEIDLIKNYMDFEQNRCEIPFQYKINIAGNIDIEDTLIPPMLIQPFIENAIKHGIDPLTRKGNITVNFNIADNNIMIIDIIDDGVGRKKAISLKNSNNNSLGIKLVKERIFLYNDKRDKQPKYKIIYTDLYDKNNNPTGTKVTLYIPFFN